MCILQFKDLKWQKLKNYQEICEIKPLYITKEDKVTENLAKKTNLTLSTVGNIIRKYKKYGDGTANLPRNRWQRKINKHILKWISRNVQINPFITRSEIKTDLEDAGIYVTKDTISRALYRTGFHSRSPKKKFVETYEKKVLGKGNLDEWNKSWTIRKEYSDKCLAKKWHCIQEVQYHHHT